MTTKGRIMPMSSCSRKWQWYMKRPYAPSNLPMMRSIWYPGTRFCDMTDHTLGPLRQDRSAGQGERRRPVRKEAVGAAGQVVRLVAVDRAVPVQDARHPVLEVGDVAPHDLPRFLRETEVVVHDGQFVRGDMLELLHALGHQVVDDTQRGRVVDAEEVLHDEDRVVDLALVLDLLLVGDDVVDQARVVDGGVLQGAHGAAAVDLRRDGGAVTHPAQAHGEVGAEGGAPHLQVVDRVGDAVLDLVDQLPDPALGHDVHGVLEGAPLVRGHLGRGAVPQVDQAAFHGVDGDQDLLAVQGHAVRQTLCGQAGGGEIAAAAVDERVVVVAVGSPG